MKFHIKYPRSKLHEEVEQSIVRFKYLEPCFVCGELTEFRHLDFDMPLCSHGCVNKIIRKYNKKGD